MNLSPFHFSRVFSQETGMAPHAYLIQVRIKKARGDLLKGMPIADAAYGAGFTDQSHFTRCFRKIVGITPGRYVRVHTKQKHPVFEQALMKPD
ncbi:MAG: helix-turn-helix domain-containing protein [Pseudomonadota bacterium]